MKALLVIDMQLGSFRPYGRCHDTLGVVGRINELARRFRAGGDLVVIIQHDGSRQGEFVPGSEDFDLLPELERGPRDVIVRKTANDSFYRTELAALLGAAGVTDLYVTGCATDYCVDTTVKAAHSLDFRVTVVADGHTTADRPRIDAPTLIAHHNWLWADLTPTRHPLRVVAAGDLAREP